MRSGTSEPEVEGCVQERRSQRWRGVFGNVGARGGGVCSGARGRGVRSGDSSAHLLGNDPALSQRRLPISPAHPNFVAQVNISLQTGENK